MEHSFFTLSRFVLRWMGHQSHVLPFEQGGGQHLAHGPEGPLAAGAVDDYLVGRHAPGGSLDFSAVVVKFKSDAAQLKRCENAVLSS